MDHLVKIVCFCVFLLQNSEKSQGLECPGCADFKYKFFDMPDIKKDEFESVLLGNILCRINHDNISSCSHHTRDDYINKCTDIFAKVVVKGIKGYDDNAGMKLEAISRGCTLRPKGEPDNCVDLYGIDGYDSPQVESLLNSYRQLYNTVTLIGQICYNSVYTKGYQQPLQKASTNWLDSSSFANRVHVSSVVYVISFMFSLKLIL